MPLFSHCTKCHGTGETRDYKIASAPKIPCNECNATGQITPYRKVLTLWQGKANYGYDTINAWPDYGVNGQCAVCNNILSGRKRKYCSKECRAAIWIRLYHGIHWQKRHVVVRDGPVCKTCGELFVSPIKEGGPEYPIPNKLELDHIVPISMGGSERAENLQLLCKKCHLQKTIAERRM